MLNACVLIVSSLFFSFFTSFNSSNLLRLHSGKHVSHSLYPTSETRLYWFDYHLTYVSTPNRVINDL